MIEWILESNDSMCKKVLLTFIPLYNYSSSILSLSTTPCKWSTILLNDEDGIQLKNFYSSFLLLARPFSLKSSSEAFSYDLLLFILCEHFSVIFYSNDSGNTEMKNLTPWIIVFQTKIRLEEINHSSGHTHTESFSRQKEKNKE